MPGLSSRGIFLSYRREDAAPYARLLQFQLRERIPDARVFMDLDSIEPGLDFAEVIREAVDSCTVLVALIGRQWATLADEEGRRRLDNPDDYVRFEVQAALERGVRVIPVLVDGARPLRPQQLPAELQKLARLNALELSYGRYEYDADRLLNLLQRVLAAASGTGTGRQSSPTANVEAFTDPHDVRADGNALLTDAERIAQSITDDSSKASALATRGALAATDPDRAARLIADAERAAQSITDETWKARALASIAGALAATDPDRAERVAQSITGDYSKASALASIAGALAATDPDRAERVAQSITDDTGRPARSPASRGHWQPPTRTALSAHRRRGTRRPVHHQRLLEGQRARRHRGGTGSHRPGPRCPAHRRRGTRRPVHHRRLLEGPRARQHRGGTGSHRPGPRCPAHRRRGTRRPVHHRRLPGRPARSPASRGHWQPPTRTALPGSSPTRNAPPSPSPTTTRRPARSPASRGHWQPPTRTARNASPSPSLTTTGRPARSPASQGHWQSPTRTAEWTTPGILEAVKPGRMQGHGGTAEVSGGAA